MSGRLRGTAIVSLAVCVLVGAAVMASAAARPKSGLWQMKQNGQSSMSSGSLVVKGTHASNIHGQLNNNNPSCSHKAKFRVLGSVPIVQVSYGHHHTRWYIASGVGASAVQSVDIRLKIAGRVFDATMIASFPGKYGETDGFVQWNEGECGFGFFIKRH